MDVLIVINLAVAVFVGLIAHSKGKNWIGWTLYAAILWPVALIHILLSPAASSKNSPRGQEQSFDGQADVSNDAYKIYLTKKYAIEKSTALDQIICRDKLFATVDDALQYADSLEKAALLPDAPLDPKLASIREGIYVRPADATLKRTWKHEGHSIHLYSDNTASIEGSEKIFPSVWDAKEFLNRAGAL